MPSISGQVNQVGYDDGWFIVIGYALTYRLSEEVAKSHDPPGLYGKIVALVVDETDTVIYLEIVD